MSVDVCVCLWNVPFPGNFHRIGPKADSVYQLQCLFEKVLGKNDQLQKDSILHSWGVSSGRVHGCGCWRQWHSTGNTQHMPCETWHVTYDIWHVTHDTWHPWHDTGHVTPNFIIIFFSLLYRCYYPHMLRDLVRLLTNFLCLPDHLICLGRIEQAGWFAWFSWAGLRR